MLVAKYDAACVATDGFGVLGETEILSVQKGNFRAAHILTGGFSIVLPRSRPCESPKSFLDSELFGSGGGTSGPCG